MNERIFEGQLFFEIDGDGDHFNSFETCRKQIAESPDVKLIEYRPGFFDDSCLTFLYKEITLKLEYSGFMGTELKCDASLQPDKLSVVRDFAGELYKNVALDQT
jgi:hypothetical protein